MSKIVKEIIDGIKNDDSAVVDVREWKSFNLGEIFDVSGSKTTKKMVLEESGEGEFPYVTTQAINNGIAGYFNIWTEEGNCLTIDSAVLGSCFYQEKNFSASDHVEVLRPKFSNFNKNIGLFIQSIISSTTKGIYNYALKFNQIRIRETSIKLPANSQGEPDWEYMDNYIAKIYKYLEKEGGGQMF